MARVWTTDFHAMTRGFCQLCAPIPPPPPQLFDLMTMGFKYQMLSCRHPQELLLVTLNHLHELRAKVRWAQNDPPIV